MPITHLVAAAALALPAMILPAQAAGSHTCFGGELRPGDNLLASGCDGTGYVNVTVIVRFGPAAGTYLCGSVFSWNGTLSGTGCHLH
ncbi:hypothetical protein SAMN05444920_11995 [Nonomuraea solani]|uniref:Secreted protein n=1 Tax=Nonomuraea solani TaxID=1144553 RepID=A0A1H6EW65_9ACTN|nr:hypothetical protein [Nonomuraea solani]SEH01165.1 hypothetical protein SAMN05444920_11995 [Nonomuraea solani]